MKRLLLVNPWITDVAAYDLWAWPLGLLYWASRLRQWGFGVHLIDCTDRAHPALAGKGPRSKRFRTGKYYDEPLARQPEPARRARRVFRRFGLGGDDFREALRSAEEVLGGPPDAVLVTSRMTYWYHGVAEAIAACRDRWRAAPVLLGGVYATLCPDHARTCSGADFVLEGGALETLPQWLAERLPASRTPASPAPPAPCPLSPAEWPRPAFDLCHSQAALPILTSVGCPFRCAYCASARLAPDFLRRSPQDVFEELRDHRDRWGTTDFAFYDDALLVDSGRFFEPFLDRVIASEIPVRFHTPNGMHFDAIEPGLARKMRRAGVETVRLSLESTHAKRLAGWNRSHGGVERFRAAVGALRDAGYGRDSIGVYVMAGMPDQTAEEVAGTIDVVVAAGAKPKLNEYSPIPGTALWPKALALSGGEIADEPLWQNNSLYVTRPEGFPREEMQALKKRANECAAALSR